MGVFYSMKGTEDREEELFQGMLRGDTGAMKAFFTAYSGFLTTVCSRYIPDPDDVKDILQESFIKIFRSIPDFKFQGPGSLRAWATRIVVNEALRSLNRKERLTIINNPVWELPDTIEEEEADFDEIPVSVVLEMIRALPAGYRTVFNLHIFEKKSHKEIAAMLNISENTSASQLHRAKSLLVKQINGYKSTIRRAL